MLSLLLFELAFQLEFDRSVKRRWRIKKKPVVGVALFQGKLFALCHGIPLVRVFMNTNIFLLPELFEDAIDVPEMIDPCDMVVIIESSIAHSK